MSNVKAIRFRNLASDVILANSFQAGERVRASACVAIVHHVVRSVANGAVTRGGQLRRGEHRSQNDLIFSVIHCSYITNISDSIQAPAGV